MHIASKHMNEHPLEAMENEPVPKGDVKDVVEEIEKDAKISDIERIKRKKENKETIAMEEPEKTNFFDMEWF